ncbi:MAG: sarcosine oxidase subunit gamma [Pseudomonadota bacterium]
MLTDPLADRPARAPAARQGTTLAVLPPSTALDLRARDAMVERFGAVLGCALPTEPSTSAAAGEVVVLWLGPDRWLCLGGDHRGALETAAAGAFAAVTDVSHQLCGLELSGPAARDVLAAGCRLDLHPQAMPEGFAGRTLVEKAEVILHRRPDRAGCPVFWLFVGRSFAGYLWDWLLEAGREYGVGT